MLSRRFEYPYAILSQPPGFVSHIADRPLTIAFVLQYDTSIPVPYPLRSGTTVGHQPIRSISAAANFGQRERDVPATVAVFSPTPYAPQRVNLAYLIALMLREAACHAQRLCEETIDVLLHIADVSHSNMESSTIAHIEMAHLRNIFDSRTARAFGMDDSLSPIYTSSPIYTTLQIPDLAGHSCKLSIRLPNPTCLLRTLPPLLSGRPNDGQDREIPCLQDVAALQARHALSCAMEHDM